MDAPIFAPNRARLRLCLGHLARAQGHFEKAATLYRQVLAVFHTLGDRRGVVDSLRGLAATAFVLDQSASAVTLTAASARLRAAAGLRQEHWDQAELDQALAAARSQLGAAGFEAAWKAGWAMALEQAVAYAQADG